MPNNIDEQLLENLIQEEIEKLLSEANGKEIVRLAGLLKPSLIRGKKASQVFDTINGALSRLKLDDLSTVGKGAEAGDVVNSLNRINNQLKKITKDLDAGSQLISKKIQKQIADARKALDPKIARAAKSTSKAAGKVTPSAAKLEDAVRVLKVADDVPTSIQKFAKQVDQNPGGALQTLSTKVDDLKALPANQEQNLALTIYKAQKSAPIGTRKFPWQQILAAAGLTIAVALLSQLDPIEKAKADPEKKKKASGVDPCIKFAKLAMRVTGTNNPKLATKTIQELLVNRGYSVIRGQTDSPFAGGGKGVAQEKDFKKLGIDGRCGPGTMGAVKRFQEDNTLTPDGLVGPKTWAVLTKGLSALSPKQKKSEPVSGKFSHPSINKAVASSNWDRLFQAYVAAKYGVSKVMMRQGRTSLLGSEETASKMRELQNTVNINVKNAGLPDLATSGRTAIGGDKKTVALRAAELLDRMVKEPSYFVQKLGDGNFLNDPTEVKGAAISAIKRVLDRDTLEEWKEFDRFSKLWQ